MFEKYDTDKDGLLNSASYREFLKGIHVWGTGQYNEDEWEFKWPDECGLLKVTHYAPLLLNGTAAAAATITHTCRHQRERIVQQHHGGANRHLIAQQQQHLALRQHGLQ